MEQVAQEVIKIVRNEEKGRIWTFIAEHEELE